MAETGYQTIPLLGWGTLSTEAVETNPELVWPRSIEVFDKMRREDSQVGSVLRAVTLPIRSAKWHIDPAGARDEVVQHIAADFGLPIKGRTATPPVRSRDRFSWPEHLRLALLELVYGHSFFEQDYRIEGDRAHLHKLAWRPPRTIARIEVASDGGLQAIYQHGQTRKDIKLGVERLVAYVNEREGGNWIGQSLLRQAYKNWLLKDRMLRAQALTVERNGLGVPVYTGAPAPVPSDTLEVTLDDLKTHQESEIQAGLALTKGFRAGEAAGASIANGAQLELKGVTGRLPSTDEPIRYHDEQIARAVLAHFLNLGTETGSWALGSTFADFFTGSLNAVAMHVQDTANQHVIEDLVDINWGSTERAPRLVFEPIGTEHPATAEAIKSLIDAGALTVDDELEAYLRNQYGLPVKAAATPTAEPTPVDDDAARASAAAETVQKVYLGVGAVISQDEARDLVRRAGAELSDQAPAPAPAGTAEQEQP